MNEKAYQEEKIKRAHPYGETSMFDTPLDPINPEKGIQMIDYHGSLNSCVKPTLRIVYDQLMENLSGLDGEIADPAMIDDLLSTFRTALVMWEQIDQKVMDGLVSPLLSVRDKALRENKA